MPGNCTITRASFVRIYVFRRLEQPDAWIFAVKQADNLVFPWHRKFRLAQEKTALAEEMLKKAEERHSAAEMRARTAEAQSNDEMLKARESSLIARNKASGKSLKFGLGTITKRSKSLIECGGKGRSSRCTWYAKKVSWLPFHFSSTENKGFMLENETMKSRIAVLEEERQLVAQRSQALETHLQDARRHIEVLQVVYVYL